MITGASFVGYLFRDAQLLPAKNAESPSMGVFSVGVQGNGKDAKPTNVDCFFYVNAGKKPPFILENLKKGAKVAVIGGEMFTTENGGKTYLKCKISSPYNNISLVQKTGPSAESGGTADADDSTPF